MTPGQKIKALRELEGLSQEEMANKIKGRYRNCSITREDIAGWEIDRHYPMWQKAKVLVRYFKISLDDLFFEDRKEFLNERKPKNKLKVA